MTLDELFRIDSNGCFVADFPTFLQFHKEEYQEIYGIDVNLDDDTQDGQLISARAFAHYDAALKAQIAYQSLSPQYAQGVALSSNVKLNGIQRLEESYSSVDLTITGTAFTQIINGIARDVLGQRWKLPASVIIPSSGVVTVTAQAEQKGSIDAQAGTITTIATPTLGWQSVTNANPAAVGAPIETDAQLKARQKISTMLPSLTVMEATRGAVANVAGVIRSKGYENDTDSVDADGINPHSIAFIVEGGDSQEIAKAIASKKTPGTGTQGDVQEIVYDENGVPSIIRFSRPDIVQIQAQIKVDALLGYTSGYDELIKNAVADAINNLEIGDDVILTKLYVPANLPGTPEGATFNITDFQIAKVGDPLGTSNISLGFNEAAEAQTTNIIIVVN